MNLKNYYSKKRLLEEKANIKSIFFYRICGTGMGTAAIILKNAGHQVEGYDIEFSPPMSTYLQSTNIPLHKKIDKNTIQKFDLIVTGNVVRKDSEDAHFIEESGVPFASFPAALGALVLDKKEVVGIAGTHGKTTTTWLATQVYEKLGNNPGYFIGGVLNNRDSGRLGTGKFFIESDEYDSAYFEKVSKFRKYSLDHLILTSLEFDHADIFQNIDAIIQQFVAVIPGVSGTVIANADYSAIQHLYQTDKDQHQWQFYGDSAKCGDPKILSHSSSGTTFTLKQHTFSTNLTGRHNILNLSAVILFALKDGYNAKEIQAVIRDLSLVKRRQEFRGYYKGSIVIDDFAHHPRAVKMTIEAIKKKYPSKKIITFLEPRSATARSNIFQDQFFQALRNSDGAVIIQPIPTTVTFASDLDTKLLTDSLNKSSIPAQTVKTLSALLDTINDYAKDDHLLLFLSNSTCLGLWDSSFAQALDK